MAARKVPAEPLLVVLGSTGTGKSELAVELATRFRGEIVNTDAMQLYQGLPIITNKMPLPERRGIPHHLLDHISLDEASWDIEHFKREATRVISEIRARGNLPILVGGTNYYVDALLFPNVILDDLVVENKKPLEILQEPTEVLLRELRLRDPHMADRWHPNDRRKISRSLEICLQTGKPASQLYAEQQERKEALLGADAPPWEKLLFWVHSDRNVLTERLSQRVDRMLRAGLKDEIQQLFRFQQEKAAKGEAVDMHKGIWQSIGYRQFEQWLAGLDRGMDAPSLESLETAAIEDVKVATRRYAKYQTRWTQIKQMRRLREQGAQAMQSLYLLDSTDMACFEAAVVEPAAGLTERFLRGESLPPAEDLSPRAAEILASVGDPPPVETRSHRTCESCKTVLLTDKAWLSHIKGTAHRRKLKSIKKLALVVQAESPDAPVDADGSSPPSSPGTASLFAS